MSVSVFSHITIHFDCTHYRAPSFHLNTFVSTRYQWILIKTWSMFGKKTTTSKQLKKTYKKRVNYLIH